MKKLEADCQFCGRTVYALNKGSLEHNIQAHELFCKERLKAENLNVEQKGEQITSDSPEPITSQQIVDKIMGDVEKAMREKGR